MSINLISYRSEVGLSRVLWKIYYFFLLYTIAKNFRVKITVITC